MKISVALTRKINEKVEEFRKTLNSDEIYYANKGKKFDYKKHRFIEGDIEIESLGVLGLGYVEVINGAANFKGNIMGFPNLRIINGFADFSDTEHIKSLRNLTYVSDSIDLTNSKITNLGNLTIVSGSINLGNSIVESLGKLTIIGGGLFLRDSEVKDLGNLRYIGTVSNFNDSKLNNLGKLSRFSVTKASANGNILTIEDIKNHYNSINSTFFTEKKSLYYINESQIIDVDLSGNNINDLLKEANVDFEIEEIKKNKYKNNLIYYVGKNRISLGNIALYEDGLIEISIVYR